MFTGLQILNTPFKVNNGIVTRNISFLYSYVTSNYLRQIHFFDTNSTIKNQHNDDFLFFIECTGVDLSNFHINIYQKALLTLLYISHFIVDILFCDKEEKILPTIKPVIDLLQSTNNILQSFRPKLILMLRNSGVEPDLSVDNLETINLIQIQSDQIFKENLLNLLQTEITSQFMHENFFVYMQSDPKFDFQSFLTSISRTVNIFTYLPSQINIFYSCDFIALFQMFSGTILKNIDNQAIQSNASQIFKKYYINFNVIDAASLSIRNEADKLFNSKNNIESGLDEDAYLENFTDETDFVALEHEEEDIQEIIIETIPCSSNNSNHKIQINQMIKPFYNQIGKQQIKPLRVAILQLPDSLENSIRQEGATNSEKICQFQNGIFHHSVDYPSRSFLNGNPSNFLGLLNYLPFNQQEEIQFLINFGFLENTKICQDCKCKMYQYSKPGSRYQIYWRCYKCKKTTGILEDSIFAHFNCDLYKILIAFFCFGNNETLERTINETGLSGKTVQSIFRLLRMSCTKLVQCENNGKIGGANDPVEIDETHISRRKYNRGRNLCHFWIIGGISETTDQIFLTSSVFRTAEIMKKIIYKYVKVNTHIKTDQYKSYNWLDLSPDYIHSTVNHSINFVNPIDGTNTQKIERLWEEVKNLKRRRRGFKIDKIEDYIQEFIWRRNFLKPSLNKFFEVLRMTKLYFN
jgi:hypothetical protein